MAYNYSDLGTEQQMIAEAKKFVNDSVADKVDKVAGKGLSTEDYTTNEKNKLAGIEPNATKTESSTTNGNIKINGTETSVYTHPGSGTNPHGTTAADVGLGDVDNTSDADKPISTATQSALNNKADKTNTVSTVSYDTTNKKLTKTINGTVSDIVSVATIKSDMALGSAAEKDVATTGNASSSQVVMGNDTRLSDARNAADVYSWAKASTKPSYTASEVGAIASTLKGANNGVAELDSAGKVPASQLPSYVDDVLEYNSTSDFPATGEGGKIYVAKDTDKTYRWSGTGYTEISASLALGETSSTAYRGDRGKIAYDHSQSTHARTDATAVTASSTNGNIKINGTETTVYTHPGSGTNPHGTTKADVGLGNVGNFKAVSTVASQGLTDTEKSNARANIGAGTSSFSGSYNDLSNKPTIPAAANNGTLTIQKNGTNVQTFTANQSTNATANITVPTKVSELSNDAGYTANTGTITGITMNGASKGTSGVVNLGTVLTAHQDISGKADKTATVSTVAWDNTNKKLTKTINGTTSDVVTGATILSGLTKAQVTTALGYTPPTTDTDTKNTAGSTDTSSKIFLIGATSQAANPQTYSDNEIYVTSGVLTTKSVQVGGTAATIQFNTNTKSIDFVFAS